MFVFLIGALLAFLTFYIYGTRTFKYWSKRSVKHDPPIPYFGTAKRLLFQEKSYAEIFDEMYWKYPNERFVGFYLTTTPLLILRNPELVQRVLISGQGDLWKLLRQRLTPAFTSGKLKAMFPLIVKMTEKLKVVTAEAASSSSEVNILDIAARYSTDFIGACGFGIDMNTLSDENSLFLKLGQRIFNLNTRDTIVSTLKYMFPFFFQRLHFFSEFVEKNSINLVKQVMQQRNYISTGKNDFIDILLEYRGNGKIRGDSLNKQNPDGSPCMVEIEFDDVLMAAQVFVFFGAGFETSATSISYTLHELAHHPEYQRKCQEEIDEVLARHGNKLSYEAVKEMKYLDMCLKEAMRMFTSCGYLMRQCVKPYTIPGTNITIDKGVKVVIPVKSFHSDPQYFENPEEFRPNRFSSENISKINNITYLPFGAGPRACIGGRLGYMQSQAGLAALLSEFSVARSKNTNRKPPIDPAVFLVQTIKGGLPLKLAARKKYRE